MGKKVKFNLGIKLWKQRPTSQEAGGESNDIVSNPVELSIPEFIEEVESGKSFTPAYVKGSRCSEDWQSQQLICLDFDKGILYDEFFLKCQQYNLIPVYCYKTFRCSNTVIDRFRAVFVMDIVITNHRLHKLIMDVLHEIFPEIDTHSKVDVQLFFAGRETLYRNENNIISFYELLTTALPKYFKDKDKHNYATNMQKFCDEIKIEIKKGIPRVELIDEEKDEDLGFSNPPPLYYYLINRGGVNYYKMMVCFKPEEEKARSKENWNYKVERPKAIKNFKWQELRERCRLWREFETDTKWLWHRELFGIVCTMINIVGGTGKFLDLIESSTQKTYRYYQTGIEKDWYFTTDNCNRKEYKPERCDKFCDYARDHTCKHAKNMIAQVCIPKREIQIIEPINFITLEEARAERDQWWKAVKENPNPDIFIGDIDCEVGKTFIWTIDKDLIEEGIMGALSTHKLIDEVAERMKPLHGEIVKTPQIDHPDLSAYAKREIQVFLNMGDSDGAKKWIEDNFKSLCPRDQLLFTIYLNSLSYKQYKYEKKTILTTHHRIPLEFKNVTDKTIIIDEDIRKVLQSSSEVYVNDLKYILLGFGDNDCKEKGKLHDYIEFLKVCPVNTVTDCWKWSKGELEVIRQAIFNPRQINSPVFNFLKGYTFQLSENREVLYVMEIKELPQTKIVILSATIDPVFFEKMFPNRKGHYFKGGRVKPKGTINQFPDHTYSAQDMRMNDKLAVRKIKAISGENTPTICLKEFAPDFNTIGTHGSVEGGDTHKDKKMINVVSVLHYPPTAYLLIASAMGYRGLESQLKEYRYREIEWDGMRFWFMTFPQNSILFKIQMSLLSACQYQALHRNRINIFDNIVNVFSNFPIQGANFHSIDKELEAMGRIDLLLPINHELIITGLEIDVIKTDESYQIENLYNTDINNLLFIYTVKQLMGMKMFNRKKAS